MELCDGQGGVALAEIAGLGREGVLARTLQEASQVCEPMCQPPTPARCACFAQGAGCMLLQRSRTVHVQYCSCLPAHYHQQHAGRVAFGHCAHAQKGPHWAVLQVPRSGWQWEVAAACGSLKGGRADWLVEKCVELGADAFVPLLTQRSPIIGSSSSSGGGDGSGGGGGGGSSSSSSSSSKKARKGRGGCGGGGKEERGAPEGSWGEDGAAGAGREGRWQRLATAALKQSLRAHAMRVRAPCDVVVSAAAAARGVLGVGWGWEAAHGLLRTARFQRRRPPAGFETKFLGDGGT